MMIKLFFERLVLAVNVLLGRQKLSPVITEVKKDTDMYNLVQSNMMNIELAPIKEKIESIEKILYYTTKTLTILTGQTSENKQLLVNQAALTEEMIAIFEQIMKSVSPDHHSAELGDLNNKTKKPTLN